MPFKSEAQRKFLFAKHPGIAQKWADKYGIGKNLPTKLDKTQSLRVKLKSIS